MAVAAVNTARGMQMRWNWSKGAIASAQAEEVLEILAAREPGALGIVACHHPLVEMTGGPMTGRVRGGEAAARRFCEGGVDLVLTGHIHVPFAMAYPYGDGHAYAVGAGTLSLRERGAPAGFNLIEADSETIGVTANAWTGSHFEVWRTWSFPRRRPPEDGPGR
jgi:3',5'-cyclic AMP phosphodiesterase CpdA